jgi:hypothetical protein
MRALALAVPLLLAAAPSVACNPDLIDPLLLEAEAQLSYAVRSPDIDSARAHLRRVAFNLAEAEQQFISCNCVNASAEVSVAVSEARRAAAAQGPEEMAIAVEASIQAWQITFVALQEDLCR